MNTGGAETFLMKMYRALDRSRYQMDFCVAVENNYYREEIEGLGGLIYNIPPKSKHPIDSFNAIRRIVSENGYRSVMRVNQHSLSTLDLVAARLGGAKKLVMRSSNASSGGGLPEMLHLLFRPLAMLVPNVRIAPSTAAAEYSFGKGCIQNGRALLLPNALDIDSYRYSERRRAEARRQLGLSNEFVVGHVGRFNAQKNHVWAMRVFARIREDNPSARLILVGDGDLLPQSKELAAEMGLGKAVMFLGVRKDVADLMAAMDVFMLPSFYEGMPNVVLEAQATGLPCVVSSSVTTECGVTDLVEFVGLNEPVDSWAHAVGELSKRPVNREDYANKMKSSGYGVDECVERFVELVFNN